jgi:hypothetical protein
MLPVALNDPFAIGEILDRPVVLALFPGQNTESRDVVCVVHAKGSDSLRVMVFRTTENKIERILLGPETGEIASSPGATFTKSGNSLNSLQVLVTASHGKASGRLKLVTWDFRGLGGPQIEARRQSRRLRAAGRHSRPVRRQADGDRLTRNSCW